MEFGALGHPLRQEDIKDATAAIVRAIPEERRKKHLFEDGKLGRKFIRRFMARHGGIVKLSRPLRQESVRFNAANAENLAAHFASLEAIITEKNIDASRIANLDETGLTLSRDYIRMVSS